MTDHKTIVVETLCQGATRLVTLSRAAMLVAKTLQRKHSAGRAEYIEDALDLLHGSGDSMRIEALAELGVPSNLSECLEIDGVPLNDAVEAWLEG